MAQKKLIIFMPSIEGGGVEKNFFLISNYLSNQIDKITVITLSKKYKKYLNKKIKLVSTQFNFWDRIGRRLKFLISIFLLFKEIIINKNVTVLSFQGHVYSILLCKIMRVKIIIRSNSSPTGWSKNFIKIFLYKFVYSLSDKIIVNSIEFKKEMKYRFNLNTTCIYNPLNTKEIISLSRKKIKFNFFEKNYLNMICVGRLDEQKDHISLLKAITKIKKQIPFKLLLMGNGREEQNIRNFIERHKLNKDIKILGFNKNPYPYILKSNIFLLSSRYEGLPNVLLEAQTLNKFIISSNCKAGPSEILDYGKGGLLYKVGNYKKLAESIIDYYYNKRKYKKRILHSKKKLYRFDYKKNLSLYYRIVNSFN